MALLGSEVGGGAVELRSAAEANVMRWNTAFAFVPAYSVFCGTFASQLRVHTLSSAVRFRPDKHT